MRRAAETLDELGVGYEARIVSARSAPDRSAAFAEGAKAAGFKIVVAGAGVDRPRVGAEGSASIPMEIETSKRDERICRIVLKYGDEGKGRFSFSPSQHVFPSPTG
jgi:hypothetical protein